MASEDDGSIGFGSRIFMQSRPSRVALGTDGHDVRTDIAGGGGKHEVHAGHTMAMTMHCHPHTNYLPT